MFFRVLACSRGALDNLDPHVEGLYNIYKGTLSKKTPMLYFSGMTIHQLYDMEQLFQVNINVFELFDRNACKDDNDKGIFDDVDEVTIRNDDDDDSDDDKRRVSITINILKHTDARKQKILSCDWMTSLHKLDCETLPPKEAFHSELKNENYACCQKV